MADEGPNSNSIYYFHCLQIQDIEQAHLPNLANYSPMGQFLGGLL
jgi:hypothetical protein